MKATIRLFIIWVLFSYGAKAQQLFTARYSFPVSTSIYQITELKDSNLIFAGQKRGAYIFPGYHYNASILKTDKQGEIIWFKEYAPANSIYESNNLQAVEQFEVDSLIFSGYLVYRDSNGLPQFLPYIGKMDTSGVISTIKGINYSNIDAITTTLQTRDSGFIVGGVTNAYHSTFPQSPTPKIFLLKFDRMLNQEWSKLYGDSEECNGAKVIQLFDGGFAISGHTTQFSDSLTNWFVMRTDSVGNVVWAKREISITEQSAYTGAMVLTKDSSIAVAYLSDSPLLSGTDVSFAKISLTGTLLWHRIQGDQGGEAVYDLVCMNDNGFIMLTPNLFRRFDSLGNVLSAVGQNPGIPPGFSHLIQTKNGNFVIAGRVNQNKAEMLVSRNDSNGFSACTNINFTNLYSIPSGLILTDWSISDSSVMFLETSVSIASYDSIPNFQYVCFTDLGETLGYEELTVYPNPIDEVVNIEATVNLEQIEIYSIQGQILNKELCNAKQKSINVKNLVNGVYILKIYTEGEIIFKKVIKI
jgi:hypothetical protein